MKFNLLALLAVTAISLTAIASCPAYAQGKMTGGKMAPMGKMEKKDTKSVYVCKMCKSYYSASAAKKMMFKDPMGHKLTKMDKAPAGYADGSKMKMGGKMSPKAKMESGKM